MSISRRSLLKSVFGGAAGAVAGLALGKSVESQSVTPRRRYPPPASPGWGHIRTPLSYHPYNDVIRYENGKITTFTTSTAQTVHMRVQFDNYGGGINKRYA